MSLGTTIYFVLITLVISCFIIPFLSSKIKSTAAFAIVLLNAVVVSIPAICALNGNVIELILNGGNAIGNIPIRIDALSAWFILIVNFISVMGALYGIGYMKSYENQKGNSSLHWILFIIFHLSMLAVCSIQNSLIFLIVWEIMSLSSLLLVIFEHDHPDTLKAGINYLIQMHICVALLSVAFIWVYFSEGSFDFTAIAAFFKHHQSSWLFLIFFIGFGIKAGFIPFHTWLPHAHPAAPSHVSGVMSGVIVKMGIYGVFRIVLFLKHDF